jgi:uncharacterized SAM-binding protein YcdF (DUF218 family)
MILRQGLYRSNASLVIPAIHLFNAIRKTQPINPAVGVCLEGDTTLRLAVTVSLYRAGRIHSVILSGGVDDPSSDNLPAASMKKFLLGKGLPEESIYLEEQSQTTHDHPLFVNAIARKQGFAELLIITSGYHLLRAYLRFLKVVLAQEHPFSLFGYPAGSIRSWFQKSPTEGGYRILSFFDELAKIRKYEGLASFDEAWEYIRTLNKGHQFRYRPNHSNLLK